MKVVEVEKTVKSWSAAVKRRMLTALVADLLPPVKPTKDQRTDAIRTLRKRSATRQNASSVDDFLKMENAANAAL